MAAPTTTINPGQTPLPTIGSTGEANGLLYVSPSGGTPGPFLVGVSGAYTGTTLVVRGRLFGCTNFYPLFGVDQNTKIAVNGSGVSPADNSQNSYLFQDASAYDQIEIYASAIGSGGPSIEIYSSKTLTQLTPVPNLTLPAATAATTITAASATALVVGPNGTTNPTFSVNTNTGSAATGVTVISAAAGSGVAVNAISSGTNEALTISAKGTGAVNVQGATNPGLSVAGVPSAATGLKVTPAAAASGLALATISSGTNESMTLDAKGSGTITIGGVSTGSVQLGAGAALVKVPGTLTGGGLLTCGIQVATSGPVIYSGSGAPTISAAVQGSIYLRTDGSSTSTRAYIATNTSGTWTALTTAA